MNPFLEQSLLKRELLQPNTDFNKRILEDDDLLAQIAGLVRQYEPALKALIQARLTPIKESIIYEIVPVELMIYRQCLLEVSMIYDDAIRYETEYKKREDDRKEKATTASLASEVQPAPEPDTLSSV